MSPAHASERRFVPNTSVDLERTIAVLRRGQHDPTLRVIADQRHCRVYLTARLSEHLGRGVAAVLEQRAGRLPRHLAPITVAAWGAEPLEVEAFLDAIPSLLGFDDDWSGLLDAPTYPLLPAAVRSSHRLRPGLRLCATGWIFKHGVSAIFEQRVTGSEAIGAWQRLAARYGDAPPPSPHGAIPFPVDMRVFPTPRAWLDIPSWEWRRSGVDGHRRDAVRALAETAPSLIRLADHEPAGAVARALAALPGIGPWTIAETMQRSHGLPDAISVGDYHLAHGVCFALDGRRGDDTRMLELLKPWAGHRQRVVRMIGASGLNEPRRGPRVAPQSLVG